MPNNYYQILKLSEHATLEEINQAYTFHLKKWQLLKEQQPPHLQERTNKLLAYLDQAYQVLSDPEQRTAYDKRLKQETVSPISSQMHSLIPPSTHSSTSSNKGFYISIIILLALIAIGIFYLIYQARVTVTYQPTGQLAANSTKQNNTSISTELKIALEKADQQKIQNAQNASLKALAKTIADNTNNNLNIILNNNTKFIGAQAANQNVTFRFLVIDGISYSQAILNSYLTERFIADNNEVCNDQQVDLSKGILYTFAYYDNKGKLLASYYIDQQVCQSPATKRIVKHPDSYQLEAKERPLSINTSSQAKPTQATP